MSELVACLLVVDRATPLYTINVLCRLTRYTAREARPYMRRREIIYAVYKQRLARALIARMHMFATKYDGKESYRYIPRAESVGLHLTSWNIPAGCDHRAFSDVTIVARARIYMRGYSPACSWLTVDCIKVACVRMVETEHNGVYKYRMRLPTRDNPICTCCIDINRIGIIIEQNHHGLVPSYDLKNIILYIKIKFKTNVVLRRHESVHTSNLFTRTFCIDTAIMDANPDAYMTWVSYPRTEKSYRG